MTHKNSRGDKLFYGDKDSKGCEIGVDTPVQKGFYKYVITDELGALRLAYEGFGFGRRTDTLSRSER